MVKKAPAKAKTQKKPARAVKTTVVKKAARAASVAKPKTPAAGKYAQPGAPWWKAYLPK